MQWFEEIHWPDGRCFGKCGSTRTREASHKTMPYWCSDGRSYFSVKTGTALERSKVPLRKWAIAVYLCLTRLCRRLVTRFEKMASSYLSLVMLVTVRHWLQNPFAR